jgi:hypothetical protein
VAPIKNMKGLRFGRLVVVAYAQGQSRRIPGNDKPKTLLNGRVRK